MSIRLSEKYTNGFIGGNELLGIEKQVKAAVDTLNSKSGLGSGFLGWTALPQEYDKEEFTRIKKVAQKIKEDTDIFIVIGIGGSYLGARAAIEFLKTPLYNNISKNTPDIYFAGNSISTDYLNDLLTLCNGKRVSINVISKSGTTTEPALAFRIFKEYLETNCGAEEAKGRIYITTDKAKGTLKKLADTEGYQTFVVPDDIGGRYSVLTAVGLLPIAVSGADIDMIMLGAHAAETELEDDNAFTNPCYKYAALRNILYRKGKTTEILVNYEPRLTMFAEWWKQLFGESEGKDNKGLFPASLSFSTDLHSLGQYVQQGLRNMFETVLWINNSKTDITIKSDKDNADGLNFLSGRDVHFVNRKAFEGTLLAHYDGGVPNIVIEIDKADEFNFGYLVYFFEKACAVSGYLLGVNPFDQPGVEAYKKNMFALLGKPGYENEKEILEKKLGL